MERPTKGDTVLIKNENGQFVRKILWVGDNHIEWRTGWAKISQLTPNQKRRSTKFVYDEQGQETNRE